MSFLLVMLLETNRHFGQMLAGWCLCELVSSTETVFLKNTLNWREKIMQERELSTVCYTIKTFGLMLSVHGSLIENEQVLDWVLNVHVSLNEDEKESHPC